MLRRMEKDAALRDELKEARAQARQAAKDLAEAKKNELKALDEAGALRKEVAHLNWVVEKEQTDRRRAEGEAVAAEAALASLRGRAPRRRLY